MNKKTRDNRGYGKYNKPFLSTRTHKRYRKRSEENVTNISLKEKAKIWTSLVHSKKLFENFIVAKTGNSSVLVDSSYTFLHKTSWLAMN